MRPTRESRGFTLIEMSVIVCITTVLATVGYVGYRRHVAASHVAEATNMTSAIRQAQEAYKAETGVYANVSSTTSSFYPADTPGPFVTAWGGPCSNCVTSDGWTKLAVHPDAPVMFGYATTAGVGGSVSPPPAPNGPQVSVPAAGGGGGGSPSLGPTDPFYFAVAQGDTDGDGAYCQVLASSTSNALIVTNEGE